MIRFNPLNLLYFVRVLWLRGHISQKELDDATPTPVEANDATDVAIAKLQAQINSLISSS